MIRPCLLSVAALGLLLSAAQTARGQTPCSGATQTVTTTTTSLAFPNPVVTDFDNYAIVYGSTINVTVTPPNNGVRWDLCVKASTPNMGPSTDGTYLKPIGDLQVKLSSATNYTSVSDAAYVALATNQKGTKTFTLNVQILLSWALDLPGTYHTDLLITAQ